MSGTLPKGISRTDSDKNHIHGFLSRVHYKGQLYAKFFYDSKYGGADKALAEALKFRNETEERLGKVNTDRTIFGKHKNNNTGVVGVTRKKKNGYDVFEVCWSPVANKLSKTTVSVHKYGESEAFRRACFIREQKLKQFFSIV